MTARVESGACFCGAIAAELRGEPFWICYDHDDDCRRALGSPLTIWVGYRPDQVRFTRGSPRSFSKTAGVVRTFCPDCGTSSSLRAVRLGWRVRRNRSPTSSRWTTACAASFPWLSEWSCPFLPGGHF